MKGAKPFVPRHIYRTIIAVKVSKYQLDEELKNNIKDLKNKIDARLEIPENGPSYAWLSKGWQWPGEM